MNILNNTRVYFILIALPITIYLFVRNIFNLNDSIYIAYFLISYIIYRTFLDTFRLRSKGVIKEIKYKNLLSVVFFRFKYFRSLYTEN